MINGNKIQEILSRYPEKRSAVIPLLWELQKSEGWIKPDGIEEIAEITGTSLAEVWEVISFYTMFKRKPSGKFLISLCNNLSCALCNSGSLLKHLEKKLGIKDGETTQDGIFSIETVECLGACSAAPVMLVNEELFTNLTTEKIDEIIEKYKKL